MERDSPMDGKPVQISDSVSFLDHKKKKKIKKLKFMSFTDNPFSKKKKKRFFCSRNFQKESCRLWKPALGVPALEFFKNEKPALGVSAIEIFLKADVVNAGLCHMFIKALV